jgi:hypothetical protein
MAAARDEGVCAFGVLLAHQFNFALKLLFSVYQIEINFALEIGVDFNINGLGAFLRFAFDFLLYT